MFNYGYILDADIYSSQLSSLMFQGKGLMETFWLLGEKDTSQGNEVSDHESDNASASDDIKIESSTQIVVQPVSQPLSP